MYFLDFFCFEVCRNDLALTVSRFCTNVSVSDTLLVRLPLVSTAIVLYMKTRFGSLELKSGSLESEKIIGSLESKKIRSLE